MQNWQDLPVEIQQKMLLYQLRQTGKKGPAAFIKQIDANTYNGAGGIDWEETSEGYNFWWEILINDNIELFFDTYPKNTEVSIKNGVQLIAEERQRQIDEELYTSEHDAEHTDDSIAYAAACYTIPENGRNIYAGQNGLSNILNTLWPWDKHCWKPSPDDRIRELTKAGALIAAEIDRLQYLNKTK